MDFLWFRNFCCCANAVTRVGWSWHLCAAIYWGQIYIVIIIDTSSSSPCIEWWHTVYPTKIVIVRRTLVVVVFAWRFTTKEFSVPHQTRIASRFYHTSQSVFVLYRCVFDSFTTQLLPSSAYTSSEWKRAPSSKQMRSIFIVTFCQRINVSHKYTRFVVVKPKQNRQAWPWPIVLCVSCKVSHGQTRCLPGRERKLVAVTTIIRWPSESVWVWNGSSSSFTN